MSSPLTARNLAAVRWYVEECTRNVMRNREGCALNSKPVEEQIADILKKQTPLTKPMVLWRGHVKSPKAISSHTWFSTSESQTSAKNLFTNTNSGCCLFKIHVMPGIHVLNVSKVLRASASASSKTRKSPSKSPSKSPTRSTHSTHSKRKNNTLREVLQEEKEWIVEGGGVFYQDKEGVQKGFRPQDGYFETYYYPKGMFASPKRLTASELVSLLDPEEYEFVTDSSYFNTGVIPKGQSASPATKEAAVKEVQRRVDHT